MKTIGSFSGNIEANIDFAIGENHHNEAYFLLRASISFLMAMAVI